jgi:hypothetical protein
MERVVRDRIVRDALTNRLRWVDVDGTRIPERPGAPALPAASALWQGYVGDLGITWNWRLPSSEPAQTAE